MKTKNISMVYKLMKEPKKFAICRVFFENNDNYQSFFNSKDKNTYLKMARYRTSYIFSRERKST